MSSKGALLDAVQTYMRELHGQPDKKQLVERLEELRREIGGAPDPKPTQSGAPPVQGQTTSSGESATTSKGSARKGGEPNWPSKGEIIVRFG